MAGRPGRGGRGELRVEVGGGGGLVRTGSALEGLVELARDLGPDPALASLSDEEAELIAA